jgi:hypothetical protein
VGENWEVKVVAIAVAAALAGGLIGAGGIVLLVKRGPAGSTGPAGKTGPAGPPGPSADAAVADLQSTTDDLDTRVSDLESSLDDPGETMSDLDSRVSDLETTTSDLDSQISSFCIQAGC